MNLTFFVTFWTNWISNFMRLNDWKIKQKHFFNKKNSFLLNILISLWFIYFPLYNCCWLWINRSEAVKIRVCENCTQCTRKPTCSKCLKKMMKMMMMMSHQNHQHHQDYYQKSIVLVIGKLLHLRLDHSVEHTQLQNQLLKTINFNFFRFFYHFLK